jgi:hypothetical protein
LEGQKRKAGAIGRAYNRRWKIGKRKIGSMHRVAKMCDIIHF